MGERESDDEWCCRLDCRSPAACTAVDVGPEVETALAGMDRGLVGPMEEPRPDEALLAAWTTDDADDAFAVVAAVDEAC